MSHAKGRRFEAVVQSRQTLRLMVEMWRELHVRESTTPEEEDIATTIVDAAYRVHTQLGPGLLESVYVRCLAYELRKQGFTVETQVPVPIRYDGVEFDEGFRLDLLVNRLIIVEVKSVERMHPVHPLQTRTYIRLMRLRLEFLIDFNVKLIKNGIQRIIDTSDQPKEAAE